MIHIDANVFFYAAGREHDLKRPAERVLALARGHRDFFTDAEVFQEILHRFLALRVWSEQGVWLVRFAELMRGRTEPMIAEDVERAGELAVRYQSLSARDLIHVAIMRRVGSSHIVSADRGFDAIDGITRFDPLLVDEWQSLVTADTDT
ncbi:MAG: type II toxin-antitoxin system VapC family toxin [Dehalococcoidia bacterium]